MYHLILYFWNRFEVPALEKYMWNWQQPGIHITTSILTSTLHIARVNMRNPVSANNSPRLEPVTWPNPSEEQASPTVGGPHIPGIQESLPIENPDTAGRPLQFAPSDTPQTDVTPNSNSLNPFSSLLLGILAGMPDNHISFFSMFRDMQDPTQVYAEPFRQENRLIN